MLANSVLLNVRHPMRFLPRDSRIYLAEDGTTEIMGPGYEDLRFFVIAMVDPFDLIGLITGRHTKKEFWKTDATLEERSGSTATNGAVDDKYDDIEKALSADASEVGAGNEKDIKKVVEVDAKSVGSRHESEHRETVSTAGP